MSTHFRPPNKDAIKNKLITSLGMLIIISILYFTSYVWFFKTTTVDIMNSIDIVYEGESGSATIKVKNNSMDLNQRKQNFINSVEYQISPSKNLKNGDVVKISAKYDEKLADEYHFEPSSVERFITVSGLPERITRVEQLTPDFLTTLDSLSKKFLEKNMNRILESDFTSFFINSKPTLVKQEAMYRLFLDAKDDAYKDRIIDVYAITAKGPVNTSEKQQQLVNKQNTIYYMVIYNEINTSLTMKSENVYGEKLINPKDKDLHKKPLLLAAMKDKYGKDYDIVMLKELNSASDEQTKDKIKR